MGPHPMWMTTLGEGGHRTPYASEGRDYSEAVASPRTPKISGNALEGRKEPGGIVPTDFIESMAWLTP